MYLVYNKRSLRSSVVTRMKMLGIEFYCGNYDELRRMKELGGVETHCSRCKLISEQDLVKLLLCFYRFTALPRGKVLFAILPRPLFHFKCFVFTCLN